MRFEAKIYLRLSALTGGILGVIAMIIAVCVGENLIGAILLAVFVCAGIIVGIALEKRA